MVKSHTKRELKSWGKSMIIAIGIAAVVRTFFFSPYEVEGASMEPTLHNQERVFVNKWGDLKRGEIIIIKGEDENYVKRLIGLPGDTIEMENDQLVINGVLFDEPYLSENRKLAKRVSNLLTGDFGPIKVPKNQYFVMGDNRLYSMDSRNGLGFIQKAEIIGQSEFVFFPFSQIRRTD
ncbi:signal peptidase I [Neobacillus sp. LXY-1]|uniref:signal peptidase I n=1 Tax=Neobacillus sp. LXY-1 TaxID=3379133 RepID=UPI003EDF6E33